MKHIFAIFLIFHLVFTLLACVKKNSSNDIVINDDKIITIENDNNEIVENDDEVLLNFLDDAEIKKIIHENIFYGINADPNYYMNNIKYTVEYDFDKENLEIGIAQDTNYIWAYNEYIGISFANNTLTGVFIHLKTDIHFLGKYIGDNIATLDEVFGNAYKWQNDRTYSYLITNNDITHTVQVNVVDKTRGLVQNISIQVTGILSSGLLPKIDEK